MIAKRERRSHQQVIKIQRVILRQQLLVLRVNAGEILAVEIAGRFCVGRGRLELILDPADGAVYLRRRKFVLDSSSVLIASLISFAWSAES